MRQNFLLCHRRLNRKDSQQTKQIFLHSNSSTIDNFVMIAIADYNILNDQDFVYQIFAEIDEKKVIASILFKN
jgi:hypothetical protein